MIEAWHFLAADRKVAAYPGAPFAGTLVTPGLKLVLPESARIVPCEYGLHASVRAIDALSFAPGPIVQRVRLSGRVVEQKDKAAASERETLWVMDASLALHISAVNFAQVALDAQMARGVAIDQRSQNALDVKLRWLGGQSSDSELAAAWDAASAAARDAASAAAWDAASAAARDAAWDAASAAAWDAASAAAWDAAWAAAWDAAKDAARDAQNLILEAALMTQYETGHGVFLEVAL